MNACMGVACSQRGTCQRWLHLDFMRDGEARMYFCPTRPDGERTLYAPVQIKFVEKERRVQA